MLYDALTETTANKAFCEKIFRPILRRNYKAHTFEEFNDYTDPYGALPRVPKDKKKGKAGHDKKKPKRRHTHVGKTVNLLG